jgi:single-strand DNA-binding protein
MSDNTITVVGNITREPELKFLGSGNAAVKFSIAVNKRRKGKDGEYEESTSFFDVQAYGTLAENLANSVQKGNRVVVTGEIEQRSWDDKETGNKRSTVEITASEVGPSLRWATAEITRNPSKAGF